MRADVSGPTVDHAFSDIPAELCATPRWVCWRQEERPDGNGEMKATKVPYRADGKGRASTTKPATWSSFEAAVAAVQDGGFSGIGFVFCDDDDLMGIDLDHCRDPRSGVIARDARQIIDAFATYTEVSASGSGVHLILRGQLPAGAGNRAKLGSIGVEMYESGRYFVMTGDVL